MKSGRDSGQEFQDNLCLLHIPDVIKKEATMMGKFYISCAELSTGKAVLCAAQGIAVISLQEIMSLLSFSLLLSSSLPKMKLHIVQVWFSKRC